jgi:hypothetical protein
MFAVGLLGELTAPVQVQAVPTVGGIIVGGKF